MEIFWWSRFVIESGPQPFRRKSERTGASTLRLFICSHGDSPAWPGFPRSADVCRGPSAPQCGARLQFFACGSAPCCFGFGWRFARGDAVARRQSPFPVSRSPLRDRRPEARRLVPQTARRGPRARVPLRRHCCRAIARGMASRVSCSATCSIAARAPRAACAISFRRGSARLSEGPELLRCARHRLP